MKEKWEVEERELNGRGIYKLVRKSTGEYAKNKKGNHIFFMNAKHAQATADEMNEREESER